MLDAISYLVWGLIYIIAGFGILAVGSIILV